MTPQWTKNKEPYRPLRFKQIIKELYLISREIHTPYTDLLNITPVEKKELLNLICENAEQNKKIIEETRERAQAKREERKNGRR